MVVLQTTGSNAQVFYPSTTADTGSLYYDSTTAPASNATTTITFNSTTQNYQVLTPFTASAAAAGAALPAVNSAAVNKGWRLLGTDVASTSTALRIIPAGTFTANLNITTGTYALLAGNPTYGVTVIAFRVSSAGTAGAELFRATQTTQSIAASTSATLVATATIASQITLQPGESVQFEWYLYGAATTQLGQTTNNTVICRMGSLSLTSFPAPGLRTLYSGPTDGEALTTSDALARSLVQSRSDTEALTTSDTLARSLTAIRANSESLTFSEDCERVTSQQRAVTEGLSISDLVSRLLYFPRSDMESLTTSDVPSRMVMTTRTITETQTTLDTVTRVALFPRSRSETLSTSESFKRVITFVRQITETRTTTETVVAYSTGARILVETLSTSETLAKVVTYGRFTNEYPPGETPDYPLQFQPYKQIAGVVYLDAASSTPYLGGASLILVRTSDGYECQTTTSSTVDGSYSFLRDRFDPNTYSVQAPTQSVTGATSTYNAQDTTATNLVPF